MKKSLVIIIVAVLSLGLWGCGSKYNEATNEEVFGHGITFQVPASWEIELADDTFLAFSDWPKDQKVDNSLAFTFSDNEELEETSKNLQLLLMTAREKDSGMGELIESDISVVNIPAKKIEYSQEVEDKEGKVEIILLQAKDGVIELTFYSSSERGFEDFEKVLNSITEYPEG